MLLVMVGNFCLSFGVAVSKTFRFECEVDGRVSSQRNLTVVAKHGHETYRLLPMWSEELPVLKLISWLFSVVKKNLYLSSPFSVPSPSTPKLAVLSYQPSLRRTLTSSNVAQNPPNVRGRTR